MWAFEIIFVCKKKMKDNHLFLTYTVYTSNNILKSINQIY